MHSEKVGRKKTHTAHLQAMPGGIKKKKKDKKMEWNLEIRTCKCSRITQRKFHVLFHSVTSNQPNLAFIVKYTSIYLTWVEFGHKDTNSRDELLHCSELILLNLFSPWTLNQPAHITNYCWCTVALGIKTDSYKEAFLIWTPHWHCRFT